MKKFVIDLEKIFEIVKTENKGASQVFDEVLKTYEENKTKIKNEKYSGKIEIDSLRSNVYAGVKDKENNLTYSITCYLSDKPMYHEFPILEKPKTEMEKLMFKLQDIELMKLFVNDLKTGDKKEEISYSLNITKNGDVYLKVERNSFLFGKKNGNKIMAGKRVKLNRELINDIFVEEKTENPSPSI